MPAIKRLAVGSKKRGQWPSTLPTDRTDGNLITAVDIRTLVAIHLHVNELLIHNRRYLRIVIRYRDPSTCSTSGTTPRQYPAAWACSRAAPSQKPPRPTHAVILKRVGASA